MAKPDQTAALDAQPCPARGECSTASRHRRARAAALLGGKTLTVKLYGNLGRDPELRSTREQVYTHPVYDSLIDDAVERKFHKPGCEFRTFTLAVNAKDAQGQPITRWHRCIDWQGPTATYRKYRRSSDLVQIKAGSL